MPDNDPSNSRIATLFPDVNERKAAALRLVEAIRRAHAVAAHSWVVTQREDAELIRLNVGRARVLDLFPGRIRLALYKPKNLSPVDQEWSAPMLRMRGEGLSSLGRANGVLDVPAAKILEIPLSLLALHYEAIVHAARERSSWARSHDPKVLDVIADLTGEDVPRSESASKTPSLILASTIEEVRASVMAFAAGVESASNDVRWALIHPEYWVHDLVSGAFAPAKFAALANMTPAAYRSLQGAGGEVPGFSSGARPRRHLEKLLGSRFEPDDAAKNALVHFMARGLGPDAWNGREPGRLLFADLSPPQAARPMATRRMESLTTDVPLNQILYGPPGTGKTYKTAELAVQICDGAAPSDRAELMASYKRLHDEGRIAFVTFHQSYGYEDFVEGIRPTLLDGKEDAGAVGYECRPGVFKQVCTAASQRGTVTGRMTVDPARMRVWKMSLGNTLRAGDAAIYEDSIEGGHLWLGYGHGLDFTGCDTRAAVREKLVAHGVEVGSQDFEVTAVDTFKNRMSVGDAVVVSDGNYAFRAVGRIGATYIPPDPETQGQRREVEWIATFSPSLPSDQIVSTTFSQMTIYELKRHVLKLRALNALLEGGADTRNHVVIIDEINRGNVSKVLGELITLLEPDKRLGALNALTVTLPHSGESFGVPPNVYVLGTMNTADRSIAFLDTALRRRFHFVELKPDPSVLRQRFGNVVVADILSVLNARIELLFDGDHAIGHAFFTAVDSLGALRDVFLTKVIPLLEEYFYGDHEKVCHALGCPFDPETGRALSNNAAPIMIATLLDPTRLLTKADAIEARVRCAVHPTFRSAGEAQLAPYFIGLLAESGAR